MEHDPEPNPVIYAPESWHIPHILVKLADGCLCVFDGRSMRHPINVMNNLLNATPETSACFHGESSASFSAGTRASQRYGSI